MKIKLQTKGHFWHESLAYLVEVTLYLCVFVSVKWKDSFSKLHKGTGDLWSNLMNLAYHLAIMWQYVSVLNHVSKVRWCNQGLSFSCWVFWLEKGQISNDSFAFDLLDAVTTCTFGQVRSGTIIRKTNVLFLKVTWQSSLRLTSWFKNHAKRTHTHVATLEVSCLLQGQMFRSAKKT